MLEDAANGLTTRQSARSRSKSPETVKSQRTSVLTKLGARNMVQAVAITVGERQVDAGEARADPLRLTRYLCLSPLRRKRCYRLTAIPTPDREQPPNCRGVNHAGAPTSVVHAGDPLHGLERCMDAGQGSTDRAGERRLHAVLAA